MVGLETCNRLRASSLTTRRPAVMIVASMPTRSEAAIRAMATVTTVAEALNNNSITVVAEAVPAMANPAPITVRH